MTHLGTLYATVALETRPRWGRVARVLVWMLGRSNRTHGQGHQSRVVQGSVHNNVHIDVQVQKH